MATMATTACGRWASSLTASSSGASASACSRRGTTTTTTVSVSVRARTTTRARNGFAGDATARWTRRRDAVTRGGGKRVVVALAEADSADSAASAGSASTRAPYYVSVPLAAAYAALAYSSACNAFMWTLDFVDPIIPSPFGSLVGKLAVALGATTLAALNFYPQARRQLGRCARVFADGASSEQLKADAAKFGVLVAMKMGFEFVAYWKALTSFTPCTASLELAGYYGVAFVGHAAFMGAASKVIGADGQTEVVPAPVRKLIGGFDLVLAMLCFATSKLAMAGASALSGVCGSSFFILALYFTFEDKIKAAAAERRRRRNGDDDDASASSVVTQA